MNRSLQRFTFRLRLKFPCLHYPTYIRVNHHPSHHHLALLIHPFHPIARFLYRPALTSTCLNFSAQSEFTYCDWFCIHLFILHHSNAVVATSLCTLQATWSHALPWWWKNWKYACSDQQPPHPTQTSSQQWSMVSHGKELLRIRELWKRKVWGKRWRLRGPAQVGKVKHENTLVSLLYFQG